MTRRWQLAFGLLLTLLAGYIDAIGFIRLGGFYASFMSGNTTQIGVFAAQRLLDQIAKPLVLIAMFLLGSTLGSTFWILAPARWKTPVVLGLETLALFGALATGLWTPNAGLTSACMALAMGSQNAALGAVNGFRAGTTFVTGALFSFGQKLAAALTRAGTRFGWVGDATVWLALLGGALTGAVIYDAIGVLALILPAGLAFLLTFTASYLTVARRVEDLPHTEPTTPSTR